MKSKGRKILIGWLTLLLLGMPVLASAQENSTAQPFFSVSLDQEPDPGQVGVTLQIFLLMTVLSLVPALLIMLTSFTRIAIVLSLLRQALGTPQIPPTQVVLGIALFLTFFIMTPVWTTVNQKALQPYMAQEIDQKTALNTAADQFRTFMLKQTREKDLALMVKISGRPRPANREEISIGALIPAFIISELKTAFQIGFMLYVPFIVIDMVVASVLLSMGMMMLPPVMISLPFKLMLFVLADGWHLIVRSLVQSFV